MKRKSIYGRAIGLIALFILVSCTSGENQKKDPARWEGAFAIHGVNIISMVGEEILNDHSIIVRDGLIDSIVPSSELPEGIDLIDGAGKWVVPGLAEMHAHIPVARDGDETLVEETLFLYLSNGVTTIRGMLGNPYHLELRNKVLDGSILGPRIYTSGPSINGNSAPDPETAARMVRTQKEAGYDFLKLHPGLTLETFDEIDRVAEEVNIPFSGHVSVFVGIRRALEAQYASIDHIDGYIEGLVPEEEEADPESNGFFGLNFTDITDTTMIRGLAVMTREKGVWVVPTQCLLERWVGPVDPAGIIAEPAMKYMSPNIREAWVRNVKQFQADENYDPERATRFLEIRRDILKQLDSEGAGLLLGSDAPQIFNVPGFSIQHELKAMINAGLDEWTTLKMGTVNPAVFFGSKGDFGQIMEGSSADLVLVDSNPLDDISNMEDPAGVMVRGTWLSREEIAERLKQIADKYAQ